jgi:acetyl esterase/lipase
MKRIMTFSLFGMLLLAPVVHGREFTLHSDVPYLEPERAEKLDVYLPLDAGDRIPVVLYIHGGGWVQGDKAWGIEKPNCEALARAGYAAVSINYKLNTKGTCDAFPQNVYDCKTAIRWIRKEAATYGFDPDRIAVAGGSAGGHLAMLIAYTPDVEELQRGALYSDYSIRVSCVVDLFGIADVRKWGFRHFVGMDPSAEALRIVELVSPITHVTSNTVPTLMIHGTADPTVPFSQAEALVEKLRTNGVPHELIAVEGGQHAFPITPHPRNMQTDLRPAVLEFLKETL